MLIYLNFMIMFYAYCQLYTSLFLKIIIRKLITKINIYLCCYQFKNYNDNAMTIIRTDQLKKRIVLIKFMLVIISGIIIVMTSTIMKKNDGEIIM